MIRFSLSARGLRFHADLESLALLLILLRLAQRLL